MGIALLHTATIAELPPGSEIVGLGSNLTVKARKGYPELSRWSCRGVLDGEGVTVRRIALVGLAVAAALTLGAAGASAKKAPLKLSVEGRELAAGSELVASSSNLILEMKKGRRTECSEIELKGKLTSNGASTDEGSIESLRAEGGAEEHLCKGTLGPTKVEAMSLPWSEQFSSKGKGKLGKIILKQTLPALGGIKCIYEGSAALKNTTSGALTLTFANAKLNHSAESNEACTSDEKLSGVFDVTSGGKSVEAS